MSEHPPSEDGERGYAVGYGKPPMEHRFKKGQSGNPSGRGKARKAPQPGHGRHDYTAMPLVRTFLDELYANVTMKEGDKTITLSGVQAIAKRMKLEALKGNRLVQRELMRLVLLAENEQRTLGLERFKTAVEYKTSWEDRLAEARRRGEPEPEALPHPDDVVVDLTTGTVSYTGPRTAEEKAHWDRLLARRDAYQLDVSARAALYRERKSKAKLQAWCNAQQRYDSINDLLFERHQRHLEDRYIGPGAQLPGATSPDGERQMAALRTAFSPKPDP